MPPTTYYGQPALKPAPWDWKVPVYTFVTPVAGAAQLIGTIADLAAGERAASIVRRARYGAVLGAALGGPLLIGDLHTPARWYNMLRIFRATSPMSIGSWLLTSFGAFSSVLALAHYASERSAGAGLPRLLVAVARWPAAVTGAGMSFYSASLFTATSSPLWAAAPRSLSVKFGSSAVAAAAAGLSLFEQAGARPSPATAALDGIAGAATAMNLGASVVAARHWREQGVKGPLEGPSATAASYRIGAILLGQLLPLACYAINASRAKPSRALSMLASASVLCGSYLMRVGVIEGGKHSSERPVDSLRFASRGRPEPGPLARSRRAIGRAED
ncbi:MAG: polysulfide reductase NrfD [Limnobacter sp.]|nr:polysulfide reductase NrfD [Limnobacter sp.]